MNEQEFPLGFANKQLHHEQGFSNQKSFKKQAHNLVQAIGEIGTPFLDATPELLVLDTRDVVDDSVVTTVHRVEALGKKLYKAYDESAIKDRSLSIHKSIKKNSLPLFRRPAP